MGTPYNWQLRFDCFAKNGIQKVLASITGKEPQSLYFPVNISSDGDSLEVWWNDEDNRAMLNLRLVGSSRVAGTFAQAGMGGPVPIALTKTSSTPKDGAAPYHGTWEGKLGEPLGWTMRFDCFAENGIQKILLSSFVNEDTRVRFFDVANALESDGLLVWWNDEDNRATIKLRFNERGQLTGEFNQLQEGKAQGVFSRTSATPSEGKFEYREK